MHLHINGRLNIDSEASDAVDLTLTLTFIKIDFADADF